MADTKQKPKRRRRWFRYSLRTLLVVMTILCVVLAYWVHRANRQKAVVKWVEENGGKVVYDFERDGKHKLIVYSNGPGELYINGDTKPPGPKWVQDFLGKDYLATVVSVDLEGSEVKDVSALAKLGQLNDLDLDGTLVSDLTPLAGMKSLKILNLGDTQVNDLTPLAGLTSLERLWLNNTQVTQEQINKLKKALPNCKIEL